MLFRQSTMLELRKKDQDELCNLAKKSFNSPMEIWAFGSRVNGDNHDASDLDLVVRKEALLALDWEELAGFQASIRESTIPILVQVFDWNSLPPSFHTNIQKKYEVLFSTINKKSTV